MMTPMTRRCSSIATSSLFPFTEGESEQMLLPNAKPLEAEVAEKVLPPPLHPRPSRPVTFQTKFIFVHPGIIERHLLVAE